MLVVGLDPIVAIVIQTLVYTLTTRLGAPKRDRYLLVLTLGIGLIGGWLTVLTGGIAAAFLGHAITRFAVFLTTGHIGQTKPRGREVEEIYKRHRPPDGWRVIGGREIGVARTGDRRRRRGHVPRRPALYIHIPFCVSLCPYCDFVVYAGAAARGPKNRIDAFLAALHVELDLRADALDRAFGRKRPPARHAVPRRRHAIDASRPPI